MSEFDRPRRIGDYEIQRQLGRGGVGVVYQARDTERARSVALKAVPLTLAASDKDPRGLEKRFVSEGQAVIGLTHAGIASVYDTGVDRPTQFLFVAFELLRGKTLEALIAERKPIDWYEALGIASVVARALHHAHSAGVVHRNLTLANIMIATSGAPKITDFGGSGLFVGQVSPGGEVIGNPSYMSPEQALGRPADARSDIFSLGAILYELLTRKKAFAGAKGPEALAKVFRSEPPPATSVIPTLPAAVDAVLSRALAKSAADRYADAKSLAEDVEDVMESRVPRHAGAEPKRSPTPLVSKASDVRPRSRPDADDEGGQSTERAATAMPTLALPEDKAVHLAIVDGPRSGEVVKLVRPKYLIGRTGGGADLELDDSEVSRTHLLVECHGERVVIRDLTSTNGTFIDDERVTEAVIGDRAEFRVGRTRLRLMFSGE